MKVCEYCKEQMREDATVCPHCGSTTKAAKGRRATNVWTAIILTGLLLLMLLIAVINGQITV